MHIVNVQDIPSCSDAAHPVDAVKHCKNRRKQRLGNAVGIDEFGVNRVELDPGVWSTVRHWHTSVDEFVMVVSGELTLVTDDGAQRLGPGDCVGFRRGVENAHRLENWSNSLAVYMEVGGRKPDIDETIYPDDDLMLSRKEAGERVYLHLDGYLIGPAA